MQNFTGNNKYYLKFSSLRPTFPKYHFVSLVTTVTIVPEKYWEKFRICFETILLHLAAYFENSMNFSFLFSLLILSFRFYYLIYKTSNPANTYLFQFKKSFYF